MARIEATPSFRFRMNSQEPLESLFATCSSYRTILLRVRHERRFHSAENEKQTEQLIPQVLSEARSLLLHQALIYTGCFKTWRPLLF